LPTAVIIGGIGDEVDRGQRRTPRRYRMQELHRDVRGVAARSAVAHRKEPAVTAINIRNRMRDSDHGGGVIREECALCVDACLRLLRDRFEQCGIEFRRVLMLAMKERIQTL
jgi:hypothetical protein